MLATMTIRKIERLSRDNHERKDVLTYNHFFEPMLSEKGYHRAITVRTNIKRHRLSIQTGHDYAKDNDPNHGMRR